MFDRCVGTSAIRAEFDAYCKEAMAGKAFPNSRFVDVFVRAKPQEVRFILRTLMSEGHNYSGAYAAYMTLNLPLARSMRTEAIAYMKHMFESAHPERCLAMHMLSNLDESPVEFASYAIRALRSDNLEDVFAGVALCSRYRDSRNLAFVKGHSRLHDILASKDEFDKQMAMLCIARYGVRIDANAAYLLPWIKSGSAEDFVMIVGHLSPEYRHHEGIRSAILEKADEVIRMDFEAENDLQCMVYRCIGKCYFDCAVVRRWLEKQFFSSQIEQGWLTFLGIGLGLLVQEFDDDEEIVARILPYLRDEDAGMRYAAATLFSDMAKRLPEIVFPHLAKIIAIEPNDEVRGQLFNCFVKGQKEVVPAVLEALNESSTILLPFWIGILSRHLEQDATSFFEYFEQYRSDIVAEHMPTILCDASLTDGKALGLIREALRSECEFTRHQGLVALTGSGAGAAAATAELVELHLYGSEEESRRALDTLFRIGSASGPLIREFEDIRNTEALQKFQRLQRILGVDELHVRDAELVRLRPSVIRNFVIVATLIDEHGPIGFRQMSAMVEERIKEFNLPEGHSYSEQTLRRDARTFVDSLALLRGSESEESLFSGGEKQARSLTDSGRRWLTRAKAFLKIIGE